MEINDQKFISESFTDLFYDFEELSYLVKSNLFLLEKFTSQFTAIKKEIRSQTFQELKDTIQFIKSKYEKYSQGINSLRNEITKHPQSCELLSCLTDQKNIYLDLIRTNQGIFGSLLTSADWQSPSFIHSLYSCAGAQTGKIKGTINDYKRDVNLDEQEFEKQYLAEYIDAHLKLGVNVFMVSSGMAAFTTIFNFLLAEGKISGKVIMGKSCYFQYKQLLVKNLENRIIEVDEFQTDAIFKIITQEKPSVIFLDSLCNAKDLPVPDLETIIDYLIKNTKTDTYLVVDNTGLSVSFQPFKKIFGLPKKVHLILFESLMKYIHLGLDRATGGIIAAYGKDTRKIFEYRKNLGTNIQDCSVYAFPIPKRNLLERRLERYQRNAFLLANSLQQYITCHRNCPIEKIIYPGLPGYPGFNWTQNLLFWGSFFNLEFKKKNTRLYKRFIYTVINEAKRKKIDIAGGTSFGLNTTRVYLTSLWTKYGEPFVRISAGTENRYQLEILKEVFKSAIDKIDKSSFLHIK